jgi:hypothetical protein
MKHKTPSAFVIAIGLLAASTIAGAGATVPTADSGPWQRLAAPPSNEYLGRGLTAVVSGKSLYAVSGTAFWRYDISTNTWEAMTSPPISAGVEGYGALHYPGTGDIIYYLASPYSNDKTLPVQLLRYSIPGSSWERLPAPPVPALHGGSGVSLASNGDSLYATIGAKKADFLRYSIPTAEWARLTPPPGLRMEHAKLACPGSGAYIYATGGGGGQMLWQVEAGVSHPFWRYSIPLDRWESLASTPCSVGYGGGLLYPGKGDFLYAVASYWGRGLWRYSISRNAWTAMASAPERLYVGGALASGGDGTLYTFMAGARSNLDELLYEIQCLASVTVLAEPVLNLPGPIAVGATSTSGATVTYAASAADTVDGVVPVTCVPASGSLFRIGTTAINCSATNAAGDTATGSFAVSVTDNALPVLTVPADIRAVATSPSGAVVTYEVTATDSIDPSPVVSCAPASGSTFPRGRTQVTCTARDASGNAVTDWFQVNVLASALSAVGSAEIWLGVKDREDVGTRFDLRVELSHKEAWVGSWELHDVPGGGAGFDKAVLHTIRLALESPVESRRDDELMLHLAVRVSATSDRKSATARLWFNDAAVSSRVALTLWGETSDYFLRDGFTLSSVAGRGPKRSIDVEAYQGTFATFRTWTMKL